MNTPLLPSRELGTVVHGEQTMKVKAGSKHKPKPRPAWCVTSAPHVAMKLKRLFAGIPSGAHGEIWITDTPDTSRDLLWFMERYPLEISDVDRRLLVQRSAMQRARGDMIGALLAGRAEPRPFTMALPLRPYQAIGAEMILRSGGVLIGDELGLGKTPLAIGALTDPITRPALVVTMTSLPQQWRDQFAKFAPSLRVHILTKGQPYDIGEEMRRKPRGRRKKTPEAAASLPGIELDTFPDVLICNYHKLSGWADYLAGVVRTVVFDEGQELRHFDTQRYASAVHIASQCLYRTALTATPIYNVGSEMWALMNVIAPDALGSRAEFVEEWCKGIGNEGKESVADPKAFGSYLRDSGLMLRRTRTDVGEQLPPLQSIPHHVDSDPAALEAIAGGAAELARVILREGAETTRGEKMHASEEFSNRLRQATGIAKAPYVAQFVDLLLESEKCVLLFGWHRAVYDIWLEHFKDRAAMFTGSESPTQKLESKRRFLAGEARILIMSLRSGAGLDGLQDVCRTAVYGELDWSPRVHDQDTGRLFRGGQREPVTAYYLITDTGSDPVVADVLGVKRQECEAINDPDAEITEALDLDPQRIRKLAAAYLEQRGILDSSRALKGND